MNARALPQDPNPEAGAAARRKLGAFVRTLRDNGFVIGIAEIADALTLLAGPAALFASRLRPALRALLCNRLSDWQKFDELFDAVWLRRGMRSAVRTQGAPQKSPLSQNRAAAPGAGGHGFWQRGRCRSSARRQSRQCR